MPLLISILNVSAGGQFISDAGGVFVSDAGGVFDDSEGILRLSTENFAGNRYWSGDVINIDPVAWRMDNLHGGACRLSGAGSISITLAALDSVGWWVQTMSYQCRIEYTDTLEDAAILLFNCTLYLKSVDIPLSATFDVFPETYDTQLLSTATNYDSETVVIPKAFGTVTHITPVRLADTAVPTQTWVQKAGLPGQARYSAFVAVVGTDIYLGTGHGSINAGLKDFWKYDTIKNEWVQEIDFAGAARAAAVAVAVGTKIYAGTGGSYYGDWREYDTSTKAWTSKLDFGGGGYNRSHVVAAAVGTKIYAGLGLSTGGRLKDWWMYDTVANTWTAKTDFGGTARYLAVAVAVGDKIYAGIGDDGSYVKDWWMYDTVANTWTAKADFGGTARQSPIAVADGTKIYVGTGNDVSGVCRDWWEYDTVANTWTQKNNLIAAARTSAVAATVGTKIYLGTGYADNEMRDWWTQDTSSMKQQYSACGLLTCSVYDDGVDVTSNASAISGNTFTYNVQPVGKITISGTSPYVHSDDIFQHLCGSSFLNIGLNMAFAGTDAIDYLAAEQINVIDFLSKLAAAETIYFFIQSGVLNVRSFAAGYSPAVTVDVADDALNGTSYFHSQPVKIYRTKWKQRTAVEESIGKYVKEIDQEETSTTAYPYSETEMTIETLTETRSIATTRLAAIAARYLLTQTSLSMPLQNLSTKPGDELVLSDDRYTGHEIVAKSGIIRDIVFDIINKKWTIEADGSFFS